MKPASSEPYLFSRLPLKALEMRLEDVHQLLQEEKLSGTGLRVPEQLKAPLNHGRQRLRLVPSQLFSARFSALPPLRRPFKPI